MTRTRYRIFEDSHPYFMTCTIVGWLAIFTRPEAVQIIFDSWNFLRQEKGFRLYGCCRNSNILTITQSSVAMWMILCTGAIPVPAIMLVCQAWQR